MRHECITLWILFVERDVSTKYMETIESTHKARVDANPRGVATITIKFVMDIAEKDFELELSWVMIYENVHKR